MGPNSSSSAPVRRIVLVAGRQRKDYGRSSIREPRPGTPRSITDAQVEEVVTKTLESMPKNSTHWSTRLMAQ